MTRWRSAVSITLLAVLVGCGDEPKGRPVGGVCGGDSDCIGGLCYAQACMDPAGDDDGDGLTNGFEIELTTDPSSADSDSDGKPDPDELDPGLVARNSDGDALIDAVESVLADVDQDCVVDELDADDLHSDGASSPLVATLCLHVGVCAAGDSTLAIHCPSGPSAPVCDYRRVPRHEDDERACDGADNDCDGVTDEGCELVFDGLIGHWQLDGDGVDSGPYGDDGTVDGASAAADRFGTAGAALRFDGVDDRVTVGATHHPIGDVDATYTAWVKPALGGPVGRHGLVAFGELAAHRQSALALGDAGCVTYTDGSEAAAGGAACAPAGHWSFLAVVKQGRTLRFYLDARLQAETTIALGQDVRRTGLTIGATKQLASGVTFEAFAGVLDDVRLYARVLSVDDLAVLFEADAWQPVGTVANPGQSCRHVRDAAGADVDGLTPLDVDGDGPIAPLDAWCDQTIDGGGWTLAWVYGFTGAADFTAAGNAVTPIPTWPAVLADVATSTTPPTGPGIAGAIDWALWRDVGTSFRVESALAGDFACDADTFGAGSFATGVEGPVVCRALGTPRCAPAVPDWVFFWEYGPGLSADNLFYYFDGSTADNWPTHDPCGDNTPPEAGGVGGGALYLR